ncbi:hypothetical protein [Streptomyces mirabilis]|uniref:hypothetical protein n=1 Tax=Streptomyces mirabilis TaxID=68239 RepID=UPI003682BDFD
MTTSNDLRPIRSPRGIPLLGHTPQIPSTNPVEYFGELSKQFPEGIYGMDIAGIEQVFVCDPDLAAKSRTWCSGVFSIDSQPGARTRRPPERRT